MGWSRRRARGQTDPYVLSLDWAPRLIRQNIRQLGGEEKGTVSECSCDTSSDQPGKKTQKNHNTIVEYFLFHFYVGIWDLINFFIFFCSSVSAGDPVTDFFSETM